MQVIANTVSLKESNMRTHVSLSGNLISFDVGLVQEKGNEEGPGLKGPLDKTIIPTRNHQFMKDLEFELNSTDIRPGSEIKGIISVSYPGRYDGVVINTTIADSNEHVVYKSYNEKKISQNVSRLFISKDAMPDDTAEFTAVINFQPAREYEVRFRVSIIEQHKEIESRIIFARYSG